MRMKRHLIFLLFLSSLVSAADYYKCKYLHYYDLQDDGSLTRVNKGLFSQPSGSFTIDRKSGEYREYNETKKLEIDDPGDEGNAFKAFLPESLLTYGFQLKVIEYSDNSIKPFIKTSFSPYGLQTGTCEKF